MSGHSRPDIPGRVIHHVELFRHRQEAERLTATDKIERSRRALALWSEAEPFHASPAETYLRTTRGIGDWLDQFPVAETFRFHPRCPFEKQHLPCMVALVRDIRRCAGRYSSHRANNWKSAAADQPAITRTDRWRRDQDFTARRREPRPPDRRRN
jgi:hypothetical protein